MLDKEFTQPSKFRTKIWDEINDDAHRTYNTNCQIKFKTKILKSSLCDYSDAYIPMKRPITVKREWADTAAGQADKRTKQYSKIVHHSLNASAK